MIQKICMGSEKLYLCKPAIFKVNEQIICYNYFFHSIRSDN